MNRTSTAIALVALAAALAAGSAFLRAPAAPSPDGPGSALDFAREGCTVFMVGKGASADGSVMSTHAADCGMCDFTWRHVPAADHKPGETRRIYHINQIRTWPPSEGLKWDLVKKDFAGLEIPEVAHTHGYHLAVFGYMNDAQVAIGESTIGNVRKISNETPGAKLDVSMLTLLAMERASTAREAIKIMGSLAEQYGYGYNDGGEMLAVSDPNEVWEFEIMPVGPLWAPQTGKPGAVWAAQRVPDDEVAVCPNESRIGEIDLSKPDFFMASPNVVSFAVEQGLYDPKGGKPFSFKRAYSPSNGSAAATGRASRLWRAYDLLAPSRKLAAETPNMDYPFSVKPDRKISLRDLMALTRDKSEGSFLDPVRGIRGGPWKNPNYHRDTRLISVRNVEYTTVTQCRAGFPDAVGGITWVALGAQDTSCYIPFYAGVTDIPRSFSVGDHWVLDRDAARWAFDYVDFHVQPAYSSAIEDVKAARKAWEDGAVDRTAEIDARAAALAKTNPREAARFLTGYCLDNARKVVEAWWKLGDDLWVKYNHFGFYDAGKRSMGRAPAPVPPWWNRAVRTIDVLTEPDVQR